MTVVLQSQNVIAARIGTVNPFTSFATTHGSQTNALIVAEHNLNYQFIVYAVNSVGAASVSNVVDVTLS